jgi:hypothetical protein
MSSRRISLLLTTLFVACVGAFAQNQVGDPITVTVRPSSTNIRAGGTVRLTVTAVDNDVILDPMTRMTRPIKDVCTITWQLTGGTINTALGTTATLVNDTTEIVWTAPQVNGTYAIMVTADDTGQGFNDPPATSITSITVTGGTAPVTQYNLQLTANPTTINVAQGQLSSSITVRLGGGNNFANKEVKLISSAGMLATPSVITDAQGRGTVNLTVNPDQSGAIKVVGYVDNILATTTLNVTNPNGTTGTGTTGQNSNGISVQAMPPTIPADGMATSQIVVHLTDPATGAPYTFRPVTFRSSAGRLSTTQVTSDQMGNAVAILTAPTNGGAGQQVLVTVNSGGLTGSVMVMTMAAGTGTGYNPYQQQTYNPYQQQTYNPYQQQTYNPYQQQTYNPYQQQTYNPYQQQTYNPYQQQTYNPYQQQTYNPYQQQTYNPYQTTNPNLVQPGTTGIRAASTVSEVSVAANPSEIEIGWNVRVRIDAIVLAGTGANGAQGRTGATGATGATGLGGLMGAATGAATTTATTATTTTRPRGARGGAGAAGAGGTTTPTTPTIVGATYDGTAPNMVFIQANPYQTIDPATGLPIDPNTGLPVGTGVGPGGTGAGGAGGQAIQNMPVVFTTTAGTLDKEVVYSAADGRAINYLKAPNQPSVVTVTATAGGMSGTVTIVFKSPTAGSVTAPPPSLKVLPDWGGQTSSFVAENWVYKQLKLTGTAQPSVSHTLAIMDSTTGTSLPDINLGTTGVLIRDQYGLARGYVLVADDGKAQLTLLNQDGVKAREIQTTYPAGSRVTDALYADPADTLAVVVNDTAATKPEVHYYDKAGTDLLKTLGTIPAGRPLIAINGDGTLGVALPDSTIQVYNATGVQVTQDNHDDKLPATAIAVGADATWVAVASEDPKQTAIPPKLTVIAREHNGTPVVFNVQAIRLFPAGDHNVIVSCLDRTINVDISNKKSAWEVKGGGAERFLLVGAQPPQTAIIAGLRDAKLNMISRVLVMDFATGKVIGAQNLNDLQSVTAILPPNQLGVVRVVGGKYTIKFVLPGQTPATAVGTTPPGGTAI